MKNNILQILKDSFRLLIKEPKLFFPKFIIAALYGVIIIWFAQTSKMLNEIILTGVYSAPLMQKVQAGLIYFIAWFFIVYILDVIVNGMYSILVKQYLKKQKIVLGKAFNESLSRVFVVVPSSFIYLILYTIFAFPLILILVILYMLKLYIFALVFLFIILFLVFVLGILFFMFYPVLVLEKEGILKSLFRTIFLGTKHMVPIAKISAILYFLSLFSIALSFFSENIEILILFVLGRILISVLATYSYLLNPVVYFKLENLKS